MKSFPNWEAIADKLLERSDLVKEEKVVLIAKPGEFDPLIELLAEKINKTGAIYLGTFSVNSSVKPVKWETDFIRKAKGKTKKDLTDYLVQVDLGIMMPGASPSDVEYASMQDVLRRDKGRTIHFHWSGAYNLSGETIEIDNIKNEYYQKVFLETDYIKLGKIQRSFEDDIRNKWIKISTPRGTNIKFKIGNRPVTKQDGNASSKREKQLNLIDREIELPSGAIRVAPIEETVEGTIAFPNSIWSGKKVEGLVLTFDSGKVINIESSTGKEAVKTELDSAGEAGYSFREFALGFNPLLAIPEENPWIPYYGYGAGVVRLSLGDNSELGGNVKGGYVRWNFFTNATVKVGDDIWVKGGKFLKSDNF
tara:strand:+ start:2463 stop:3557 length:1095 start_codon:yes stop_codon:yes gene_type:complete